MSESYEPAQAQGGAQGAQQPWANQPGGAMAPHPGGMPVGAGEIGKVRSTGTCILLTVVTLGFYTWYWYYKTHDEMKRHSGNGLGGGIALVLAIFIGIVMPFLT